MSDTLLEHIDMKHNYSELVKLAYEIEGLLTLQAQRGENAVAMVDEMLAEKIAVLSRSFQEEADDEIAESALEEEEMMAEQPAPANTPEPAHTPEPAPEPVPTPAYEHAPERQPVTEPEPKIVEIYAEEEEETPLTLDEKLARQRAKNLFTAFTLNDKFRFRRELFRNSQEEFDDALNVISQMSTVEEAEEYVYDDLCLDPESDDVKAFMDIIIKHF